MLTLWSLHIASGDPGEVEVLQEEQVHVQCRAVDDGTLCSAQAHLGVDVDRICAVLEDLGSWPEVFSTVRSVEALGESTFAVDVMLPFPLGRWPFVARVEHHVDDRGHHVRLHQIGDGSTLWTAAAWHVVPEGDRSWVRYTWHTDALRALPAFVRRTLNRRTGHNTVWGVALAAGTEPSTR